MTFKHWLINEDGKPISQRQAIAILKNHTGVIDSGDIRFDALSQQHDFSFDNDFPLSNIPRLTQGYDPSRVRDIINVILKSVGLDPVENLKQIDHHALQPYLSQIKKSLPPIIVSLLPDESYHLADGNHRFGTAKILGLPTIRAIVLQ